jgi:hypothetical protein
MGMKCVAAGVCAAALTGCYQGGKEHREIQDNMTPELMSTAQRRVDVSDMTSLSWATDNRMFWDDLARAWYTDRPSHLTPYPVPR